MFPTMIDIASARRHLLTGRKPSFAEAETCLGQASKTLKIISLLRALQPGWNPPTLYGGQLEEPLEQLGTQLYDLLEASFPVSDALFEDVIVPETGELSLPIQTANLVNSYDDLDDVLIGLNDGTAGYLAGYGPLLFGLFLNHQVDEDSWQSAARLCGWPELDPHLPDDTYLDSEKFYDLLEAAGLPDWVSVFEMAFLETGTPFLDATYDDPTSFVFELTPQSVVFLKEQWAAAKAYLDAHERAVIQAKHTPSVYQTALDCFKGSLSPRPIKRR